MTELNLNKRIIWNSYFPIVVKYEDRFWPETVKDPEDIRNGIGFKVLVVNK